MIIVGIDPGLSGAACAYNANNYRVIDIIDLPVEAWGTKRHIAILPFVKWVHSHGCEVAAIELVNAMPSIPDASGKRRGMGAASAFRFGMCYGEVRGALVGNGLKIVDVIPGQWKDQFELRGQPKDIAREIAAALHPEAAGWLKRKKDVGRGESILVARWAALNRWELAA